MSENIFNNAIGAAGITFINMGLMLGLTFGVLILLRPVTNRLLRPRQRVFLWFAGWYGGFLLSLYDLVSQVRVLPVSFRSLVVPRVKNYGSYESIPDFLPTWTDSGEAFTLALPGGWEFPLPFTEKRLLAVGVLWMFIVLMALLWTSLQNTCLRNLSEKGEKMSWADQTGRYGMKEKGVVVRICENLPTNFVRSGHDTGWFDGVSYVICLQPGLTEEQMRLVLLHEEEHIRQHHVYYKCIITGCMCCFYWWNPLLWLAYRLTCRDMELICDEAVLAGLDQRDRRNYARTLVDLGSGRHMWTANSFGECDAALRIKNVAYWKLETRGRKALSWTVLVLLVLFFYCGGPGG